MDTKKTITLKDLQENKESVKLQEVSPNEILPPRVEKDKVEIKIDEAMGDLDKALNRKFQEVDIRREEIIEELSETQDRSNNDTTNSDEFADDGVIDAANTTKDEPNIKTYIQANESNESSMFIDEEDIDDEDEEKTTQQFEAAKTIIKEKIKPITNAIDLSAFTISKKPISVLTSLKSNPTADRTIDWALPATGIAITMASFTGYEIQKLNPQSSGKNRFNTYREIYGILFDHIVDNNKPATMEQWVKSIKFFDINHLYFGAYKASFEGANSLPYSCPHCNNMFMKDIDIDSMVKYQNDDAKKMIAQLLKKETTNINKYDVELVQVSDEYVIGLREPSIYNIIFENVILDEAFTEKYSELLSILAYVDSIFYIDRESNELRPIELKEYPTSAAKTIKNRVVRYSQIIQSLKSDQFYVFNSYIKAINDRHEEMTYVIPEVTCPKCNTVIPEQEMGAETLLFTRHQLAGIANT